MNRVPAGRLGEIAKILQLDRAFFFVDFVNAEEVSRVIRFVSSDEGVELNRAFSKITTKSVRQRVAKLCEAIGSS